MGADRRRVRRKLGRVDDRVSVRMPGGELQIAFSGDFQVSMRGPVHKISTLTLDEDCFAGAAGLFTGSTPAV